MNPSDNEKAIIWENTRAIQQGTTYGQQKARDCAKAQEPIHAPKGYTSYYERKKRK